MTSPRPPRLLRDLCVKCFLALLAPWRFPQDGCLHRQSPPPLRGRRVRVNAGANPDQPKTPYCPPLEPVEPELVVALFDMPELFCMPEPFDIVDPPARPIAPALPFAPE